jgi:hypothetical protein
MAYITRVIPTPDEIVPKIECAVPTLIKVLTKGSAYADDLQPAKDKRDPWFWSHAARFRARQLLAEATKDGWDIVRSAPNSGIHLTFKGFQPARVLKSLNGNAPHAGPNGARQLAWTFDDEALDLRSISGLTAVPLLFDWHISENGPVVHAGIPKRPGSFRSGAELYWRIPITGDADEDLNNLSYDPTDPMPDAGVILKVDPAEFEDGGL